MSPCALLLGLFVALSGAGILIAFLLPRKSTRQVVAWTGVSASLALIGAGAWTLAGGTQFAMRLWTIPLLGDLVLRMDSLSAFFVVVTGLVLLPVSVFCGGYLHRHQRGYSLRAFCTLYLALYVSIVLVLIAGDVLTFLLAWELMSIFGYLLVNFGSDEPTRTSAGYSMLAFGEAGTLAVTLGLLLLTLSAGSLDFASIKASPALGPGVQWAAFLLTFFGFGVKAGLVPVNSWLPWAYAAAPSCFLPVLAGAMLNLGLYGIMRVNLDLAPISIPAQGLVVLVVGTISAFLGILYATIENDLKTLLAHSSIENAGIIVAALGAGFVFGAYGMRAAAAIALVAAVYHIANHSFYKTLLLIGAGAVEEGSRTRDMDKLGGLIRAMPWTALFFLIGTMAISAIPPLNGFVSEWLVLQSVLRCADLSSITVKLVFALCGAGLALTAALAVTCFVKTFAMSFLGVSRSKLAERAREGRRAAVAPMAFLAALCIGFGVLPTYIIPGLGAVVTPATARLAATTLVPPFFEAGSERRSLPKEFVNEFHDLGAQTGSDVLPGRGLVVLHRGGKANPVVFAMSTSYMIVVLAILLGALYGLTRLFPKRRPSVVRRTCWDGGITRLLPEMTYTATGFSNPVRVIFDSVFHPATAKDADTVADHFRTAISIQRDEVHIVDRVLVRPVVTAALGLARLLARMHHGKLNAYLAYIILTLVTVLAVAWGQTGGK